MVPSKDSNFERLGRAFWTERAINFKGIRKLLSNCRKYYEKISGRERDS